MSPSIESAILKTIAYADIFDYPLTSSEVKKYLVDKLKDTRVEEALSRMTAEGRLIYADPTSLKLRGASGYYSLPNRGEIIKLRQQRQRFSQSKLRKAGRVASILKVVPWIKLIGVTGALAMENSDEDDDIDLIIITAADRLWLTRGLVVTFLLLTRQYRRANKIKDRVCPNLLVSEDALEFKERDLFTAHEIVQMRVIFERSGTYRRFLEANAWVGDFLPNALGNSNLKIQNAKPQRKSQNFLLDLLEELAYKLQIMFMASKKTVEVTTPSVIRFHPQDVRRRVLDEYHRRVYNFSK